MTREADHLYLGLDIGGSTTRAVVIDRSGSHRGRGIGGAANPRSQTPHDVQEHVATAVAAALGDLRPECVVATVVGVAGLAPADETCTDARLRQLFEHAVRSQGVEGRMSVRADAEIAFVAGTPERSGWVLVAGTGAIAGRLADRRLVRTVDGHGGIYGDEGSGYWLGREAVRVVLRALDGRGSGGSLASEVIRSLLGDGVGLGQVQWQLVDAASTSSSTDIAALAPLALEHAERSDALAADLVAKAAELLVETLLTLHPSSLHPTVLGGSLLTQSTLLEEHVRFELSQRGDLHVFAAGDAAGAAAWCSMTESVGETEYTTWALSTGHETTVVSTAEA